MLFNAKYIRLSVGKVFFYLCGKSKTSSVFQLLSILRKILEIFFGFCVRAQVGLQRSDFEPNFGIETDLERRKINRKRLKNKVQK
ncbi:hypothetical protein [Turicimonas muris]|uniref:Uncharacterized protein n=1 Tax=Turicimonas muris TaxID=1796652 RepID=A0A227KDC1_9BURK|nr:hypothetical protein [Turicimonas muris]ANU65703.1 hypothetical protein A4V04_04200 [Burkholderiales bacterium YL45]OXE45480.1 hypothetical protein ADH67_11125 [Turicimonas muris]QQQ96855.1 hypothetical protein I5Q81_00325 [Turicimonas muris]